MHLGVCCEDGVGVDKDIAAAFDYYKRAAQGGHLHGKSRLGNCYYNGRGVERDVPKAVPWVAVLKGLGSHRKEST